MPEVFPPGTADVKGLHVDKYPEKAEDGNWYLLGIWDEDRAVYLNSQKRSLHFVHMVGEELVEDKQNEIQERGRDLYDFIMATSDDWDTWSQYSWPYYMTMGLYHGQEGVFTKQEALVYSYRELCGHDRRESADILGKSANTIDNQLASAKRKLEHAVGLVDYLRNDLEVLE